MRTPELWGVYSSMHCWAREVGITPWSFRFPCKWSAQWRGEIPDLFQEQYLLWKWCSVLNSVKRLTHIQFYDITVRLKTSKWRYWRWIYRSFKVIRFNHQLQQIRTVHSSQDNWRMKGGDQAMLSLSRNSREDKIVYHKIYSKTNALYFVGTDK